MIHTSRTLIPRAPAIIAQHGLDNEPRSLKPARHLPHGQRPKDQLELMFLRAPPAALDVSLLERCQATPRILANRLDERQVRAARPATAKLHAVAIFAPMGHVGHQVETEGTAGPDHARHGLERREEIAIAQQRL